MMKNFNNPHLQSFNISFKRKWKNIRGNIEVNIEKREGERNEG